MDLQVQRLGINGEGVSQWYGCTIFVDGALPGEKVEASLYEKHSTYGRAWVVKQETKSPHRVEPVCPLFGRCGGCQLMHLEYSEQLNAKRQRVIDALERIGKFKGIEVQPCIASPQPLAYRNKIQLPVSPSGALGLYARNTHDLIEIEKCYIHCSLGEKAFGHIQKIIKNSDVRGLRHVLIKTAVNTNQVLVVLITSSDVDLLPMAQKIKDSMPEIKGVVQNINSSGDNTVLGEKYITVIGRDSIEEKLCGLIFKVSPVSFFQVNPPQAEQLYQTVLKLANLQGDETVLDAYCGVGTLSLLLAKHAGKVVGIECVKEAIEDAKENALRNKIENVEFICSEVESSPLPSADLVVLNPPRKGCERSVLEKLSVKKIIYVSCDPATLARDLSILSNYKIESVQPFDMFPQTAHVETVVSLARQD